MTKPFALGRRGLLRGAAAGTLALPFFESLSRAGGTTGPRKRLVIFYSPNEPIGPESWTPAGSGNEYALPDALPSLLSPLDPFRDKLLMLGGIEMKTRDVDNFGGGHIGTGHLLTGHVNLPYGTKPWEFWAGGISVDQFIANRLGNEVLHVHTGAGSNSGNGRISYSAANQPVHPREDPVELFEDLFGDFVLPEGEADERGAQAKHVLDAVVDDLARVRNALPSEDKLKLDQHLAEVEAMQAKLSDEITYACSDPEAPDVPGGYDPQANSAYPSTGRYLMDLVVEALACEAADVATIQLGDSGGEQTVAWPDEGLDFNIQEHSLVHDHFQSPSPAHAERRNALEAFYYRQFAYLLQGLDSRPEGGGTLLDNTLVMYCKALGRKHEARDMLFMLAGGQAHGLQTGVYREFPGAAHNDLLTSLCRLMGLDDVTSFGAPEFSSGPLL